MPKNKLNWTSYVLKYDCDWYRYGRRVDEESEQLSDKARWTKVKEETLPLSAERQKASGLILMSMIYGFD